MTFKSFFRDVFVGRDDAALPFLGKHVLRDIGLMEPACDNVENAQQRHRQNRALSVGLTGTLRV